MRDDEPSLALKARWVFPVEHGPIADGYLTLRGQRIEAVTRELPHCPVHDLGNVAILPGLVNAHTHLEFSDLDAPLGQRGMRLVDWIRLVMARRQEAGASAPSAVIRGLRESLASGVVAIGEIATSDWRRAVTVDDATLPEVVMFREAIGPTRPRIAQAFEAVEEFLTAAVAASRVHPAISPHAPYTVHSELLSALIGLSRRHIALLAMHLAETEEELELLAHGTGPFRELLESLGAWDGDGPASFKRPFDYLRQLAAAPRALVIHGNYLDEEEIAFLAGKTDTMAVVFCPRTHAFFGHARYPLSQMLEAGVSLALGTDSRASNPDLGILAEMQFVASTYDLARETVLRLGTLGGARALGLDRELGTLTEGKLASLAVVGLGPGDARDPHELVFDPRARIVQTWIRGQVVATTGG